jgi:alpha-ketoglutarate-dependent sulfate ester dioxygenase
MPLETTISTLAPMLDIEPLTSRIGAEVRNIQLSGKLAPETVTAINEALLKYKVLFFRSQHHLDEARQQEFGRLLGTPVPHPTVPPLEGTDSILDIDNARGEKANVWHTDVTFVDAYPKISILRAVVIPPSGGDTVWANTATAYADLPRPLRELADKLWALHSNAYDYVGSRPDASVTALRRYNDVFTATVYRTEHPVVRVHPETGERSLILGQFVQRLLGFNASDSAHLLAILQDHITREENTVRWRWSVGDVAIWDNRATQHRAVDDYGEAPRVVRRVSLAGDVPVSVDGRTSIARSVAPKVQVAA